MPTSKNSTQTPTLPKVSKAKTAGKTVENADSISPDTKNSTTKTAVSKSPVAKSVAPKTVNKATNPADMAKIDTTTTKKTTKTTERKTGGTGVATVAASTAVLDSAASHSVSTNNQGQSLTFSPYTPAKNEEYMSDAQLAHFKSILLDWKAQLVDEAESTKSYIQDESTAMPDINDRATQEEEFALALRTRDRERKLIRKIDKSLAEMDNGDYGFCLTCGVEIGLRRLEARPTATQCIDCKTLSEMKEKQAWGH